MNIKKTMILTSLALTAGVTFGWPTKSEFDRANPAINQALDGEIQAYRRGKGAAAAVADRAMAIFDDEREIRVEVAQELRRAASVESGVDARDARRWIRPGLCRARGRRACQPDRGKDEACAVGLESEISGAGAVQKRRGFG